MCVIIGFQPGESGRVRTVQHEQTASEVKEELPMVTVHHVTESAYHASTGLSLDVVSPWNDSTLPQYRSSPLLGRASPRDDVTSHEISSAPPDSDPLHDDTDSPQDSIGPLISTVPPRDDAASPQDSGRLDTSVV